jgi:hypothetical protein
MQNREVAGQFQLYGSILDYSNGIVIYVKGM